MGRLRVIGDRLRTLAPRPRVLRVALIIAVLVLLAGIVLDRGIDRPLRSFAERRINENLVGYGARVGHLDFHLLGLSMDLENVVVVQKAHPDPPVIHAPRLRMSVHWQDLLYLRLVGDAGFDNPSVHLNLAQLRAEDEDHVPLSEHGWQRALESIYPLRINELRITNGRLVYEDDSGFRPLHASGIDLRAGNIRNVRSKERVYPSTLHAEGTVFDVGRAVIDGHADFMAEPSPAVLGRLDVEDIELAYFEPIARRFGLTVKKGSLSGGGMVEVAPGIRTVDLESVVINSASVDYAYGEAPTPLAREAGETITRVARESLNNPEVLYRVRRLTVQDGTLGLVNTTQDPPYRIFFSNADFEVGNLSSRAEDGPGKATLQGAFMGSGSVEGHAVFHPEGDQANFEAKIAIRETQLKTLNDLLRARGKFDVSEGTFSLFAEVRVQNGAIDGYVKPLFKDIKVYDAEQDKHKNVFKKMYEGIVGGVAKILENRKGDVATVTSLKGPVEDPKSSAMQIIGGLIRNAFVKSILPGFQREIARTDPLRYRAAQRKERQEAERREPGRKDPPASR